MLDYESLRLIWWGLLGILLIAFAILDGFDMGVAILLPFMGKTDMERRIFINTIAPVWESNQVWLILGAGAIFAAWPPLYAVAFSGLYIPLFIILCTLILRPVALKFRSKVEHALWRQIWDCGIFIGGFIPALIFGIAVGNAIQGIPFHFDEDLRVIYTGTFSELLNPFSIGCGLIGVMMMTLQGATYLKFKTSQGFSYRFQPVIFACVIALLAGFTIMGLYTHSFVCGYKIASVIDSVSFSSPLNKSVVRGFGTKAQNFYQYPWMMIGPLSVYFGGVLCLVTIKRPFLSFLGSSLLTAGIISTVGFSLYPFLLPSLSHPSHSLTIWDASSSQRTLWIMLLAVIIFLPIILGYVTWLFRVLRGKITEEEIRANESSY
ncbi:MAG: cytochrome d ubiquinol oxidase subunit II [Alphaproteobacteria bacterium]|nr:cytochrome d ubiquinol oxidase subunit II [Alphaproteobacteria bacterium]